MIWAMTASGAPARECLESLDPAERARILRLYQKLADSGRIHNVEHFKKLEGTEFWQFKGHQARFLGVFEPGGRFVVLTGFVKKSRRTPRSEIDRARHVLNEYRILRRER